MATGAGPAGFAAADPPRPALRRRYEALGGTRPSVGQMRMRRCVPMVYSEVWGGAGREGKRGAYARRVTSPVWGKADRLVLGSVRRHAKGIEKRS